MCVYLIARMLACTEGVPQAYGSEPNAVESTQKVANHSHLLRLHRRELLFLPLSA